MRALPKICAIDHAGVAVSSAVMKSMPSCLSAGIVIPAARTPGGRPSMDSSISPSNPSRRTATTSSAIVPPARRAIGFENVPKSFCRICTCAGQATRAKSGVPLRTRSRYTLPSALPGPPSRSRNRSR